MYLCKRPFRESYKKTCKYICTNNDCSITIKINISHNCLFNYGQRGCHKKNDMVQSYHFIEIATVTEKVSKKKSKLFATRNHNIRNTRDKNCNVVILCCDL